ncbi:MAG: DNA poymerase III subunit delta' (EC [uncultured Sulfurovum sp.]|uniref:DNA poymerase III subunit delta' (EC) n=1 Tax=uncultured Sulfurovum sp. TaxID=269237 RepID=A0A6S6SKC9_9BACT|nr:MAG: DNA poymerase III subunit delta' (EC [uncultured Sulfurovum sp.]
MKLHSGVLISTNIEETVGLLESKRTTERLVKILKEDAFLVEDAKLVIEKAYMASEETTVIIMAAKSFAPVVQNKLLKVIEEPPLNVELILITQSKATILDTIRSRMPITVLSQETQEEPLGLEVKQLSLSSVYEFTQTHKRTNAKEMRAIIEKIAKEAMYSKQFNLDEKTLTLFSDCYVALDMGSPPQFVLNALLLKLLARKKR